MSNDPQNVKSHRQPLWKHSHTRARLNFMLIHHPSGVLQKPVRCVIKLANQAGAEWCLTFISRCVSEPSPAFFLLHSSFVSIFKPQKAAQYLLYLWFSLCPNIQTHPQIIQTSVTKPPWGAGNSVCRWSVSPLSSYLLMKIFLALI